MGRLITERSVRNRTARGLPIALVNLRDASVLARNSFMAGSVARRLQSLTLSPALARGRSIFSHMRKFEPSRPLALTGLDYSGSQVVRGAFTLISGALPDFIRALTIKSHRIDIWENFIPRLETLAADLGEAIQKQGKSSPGTIRVGLLTPLFDAARSAAISSLASTQYALAMEYMEAGKGKDAADMLMENAETLIGMNQRGRALAALNIAASLYENVNDQTSREKVLAMIESIL